MASATNALHQELNDVADKIAAQTAVKSQAVKARQTAEAELEKLKATRRLAKAQGRELTEAQRAELLKAKHAVENAALFIGDCEVAISAIVIQGCFLRSAVWFAPVVP